MIIRRLATACAVAVLTASIVGCASMPGTSSGGTFKIPAEAKVRPTSVNEGFAVFDHEGSTWVFATDSEEVQSFMAGDELAKHVTRMKATPTGIMKIKAPDRETIDGYLATKPKASRSKASAPSKQATVTSDENSNLAIAAKLAHDIQTGAVATKPGTHTDIKPKIAVTAANDTSKATAKSSSVSPTAIRSGFVVFDHDGTTWVFTTKSKELAEFQAGNELAKHVTKLMATPGGILKIKSPEQETIDAYLAAKSGFTTRVIDGYLWVFYEGSPEHKAVDAGEELAKHVTKLTNVGGQVKTIKAPSTEVLNAYNAATRGIATRIVGGYLWVFAPKSETLALVDAGSEPAKHVTKLTNVNGQVRTVRAENMGIINAYLAAKPGFETMFVDGYTWVFKYGSSEFDTVLNGGELAKHVTKMRAVNGSVQTFKAADAETINAYLSN